MGAVFYKKLFEVGLSHQSTPGKLCTAFGLEPTEACRKTMQNYRLEYRTEPGRITVYHSGKVVVVNPNPLQSKIVPVATLPDDTEFVFVVTLLDRFIINKTIVPAKGSVSVTDKKEAIPQPFIKTAVVAIQFAASGSTKQYERFKVLNSINELVSETMIPKNEDGFYDCTADLSSRPSGIYTFGLEGDNNLEEKFYVDREGETSGHYGILRIVKDNTWLSPDQLMPVPVMPDYNVFNYTFIKTP